MSLPNRFKPLLAINSDKVKEQPVSRYCSEKLDGVRCLVFGGVAYSRSLKPLPNKQLQEYAYKHSKELEGFDGEIIVGGKYAVDCLQQSVSFCMSEDKVISNWTYYVFDKYIPDEIWIKRYFSIDTSELDEHVVVLFHYYVREAKGGRSQYDGLLPWENLDLFEAEILAKGGEGVICRDAEGLYKFGRSGTKKPELQKLKRFQDAEFEVLGYEQFFTNTNEATLDERGYTKRSTSKEGKIAKEMLGSLLCKTSDGVEFSVGSGFTEEQRQLYWKQRDTLKGQLVKVQFFGYSKDNVPLLPVFLVFRNTIDT